MKRVFATALPLVAATLTAVATLRVLAVPDDPGHWGALLGVAPTILFFVWLWVWQPARLPRHPWSVTLAHVAGLGLATFGAAALSSPTTDAIIAAVGLIGWSTHARWYSRLDRARSPSLRVGEVLPDFVLRTSAGEAVTAASLRRGRALLLFPRGSWSPVCVGQVRELADRAPDLAARGVRGLVVGPAGCDYAAPIEVLLDPGHATARQLGLVQAGGVPLGLELLGHGVDTVRPTIVLTDETGRVLRADQTDHLGVRPEVDALLATFDAALEANGGTLQAPGAAVPAPAGDPPRRRRERLVLRAATTGACLVVGGLLAVALIETACVVAYFVRHGGGVGDALRALLAYEVLLAGGGGFVTAVLAVGLWGMAARRGRPRLAWLLVPAALVLGGGAGHTWLGAQAETTRTTRHAGTCAGGAPTFPARQVLTWPEVPPEPGFTARIDPAGTRAVPGGDEGGPGVLLVGDSFAFGLGLEDADTIAARLQAARPDLRVTNAGLPGDNLDGLLDRATRHAARLDPAAVVLLVHDNDLDPAMPFNDCALPLVCRLSRVLDLGKRPFLDRWRSERRPPSPSRMRTLVAARQRLLKQHGGALLVHFLHEDATLGDALPPGFWSERCATSASRCNDETHQFGVGAHLNPAGAACVAEHLSELLAGVVPTTGGPAGGP